jgi:hypothetical protein
MDRMPEGYVEGFAWRTDAQQGMIPCPPSRTTYTIRTATRSEGVSNDFLLSFVSAADGHNW